jgi:hypothetical protein
MLKSAEYATIKADYDEISRTHFAESYFYPQGMSFANSDALFPPAELAQVVGAEYEAQCPPRKERSLRKTLPERRGSDD